MSRLHDLKSEIERISILRHSMMVEIQDLENKVEVLSEKLHTLETEYNMLEEYGDINKDNENK